MYIHICICIYMFAYTYKTLKQHTTLHPHINLAMSNYECTCLFTRAVETVAVLPTALRSGATKNSAAAARSLGVDLYASVDEE